LHVVRPQTSIGAYLIIISESDADAAGFIERISAAVDGVLRLHRPQACHIVVIRDYFDSKWLGFSGKVLGAVGVHGTLTTLPPFHPHRVVTERHFARPSDSQEYSLVPGSASLHVEQPSASNLTRRVAALAPGTALVWYSAGSSVENRGVLMVYAPAQGAYWKWYVALAAGQPWRLTRCSGISRAEFAGLEQAGSSAAEA